MAYEAKRNDDLSKEEQKELQKQENHEANKKAVAVGIDAGAKYAPGWIGAAFKAASVVDKATNTGDGGIVSKVGAYGADIGNKFAPLAQKATNTVANNKVADMAYDAYNAKNSKGASVAADKAAKAKEGVEKAKEGADKAAKAKEGAEKAKEAADKKEAADRLKQGGEARESLPSSDEGKSDDTGEKKSKGTGTIVFTAISPILILVAPFILVFIFFIVMLTTVTNIADYQDAFGISQIAGLDTGGLDSSISDPNQKSFYERILQVKNDFQKDGKKVDPLLIVSVFHALNTYGADISYSDMTTSKITKIANAMFDNNTYSESTFRSNLASTIIPSYLPFSSSSTKEAIINEVFDYIDRYYTLIGFDNRNCSSLGSCSYNIKGFYISGSNFKKELGVNDLYVRLMQCGSYNGHDAGGQWGEPLEGEELVPFEKYILGVAYQEIGGGAPAEAFKAQMIAARSYILARPTQMGSATSWRSLEQENGKWILQVASCTADQVYCDPDKGCSAENGDGQWKQVYSGTDHGRKIKGPIAEDSPLRKYAAEVQGETLVNSQGYIVLTDFTDVESKKFASLANEGLDYKQIMIQVYSDKYPGAGSLDIDKADCGTCVSDSDYANWKQYEGDWASVGIGNSGKTIKQIGCLVTSLSIQIAKSGVQTNVSDFNPGTFVDYLNKQNAFSEGGALLSYDSVESVAPSFKYQGYVDLGGMSREVKLNAIRNVVNQSGVYAVAEVKGDTGQHWVAIDSINGDTINMMDPGSTNTNMWDEYEWYNTSRIVYYKVG